MHELHLSRQSLICTYLLIYEPKFAVFIAACQDWVANRRCKLDFDDSVGDLRCPEELGEVWQDILEQQSLDSLSYDYVFAAVKSGIPKLLRGEAWKFLRQFNMMKLQNAHNSVGKGGEKGQSSDANCSMVSPSPHDNGVVTPLSTLLFKYDYESLIRKKSKHQNDIFLDLGPRPGHSAT